MKRWSHNRRVQASLLASLVLHLLFLWAYQRWAAERVEQILRPVRFELAPAVETQRFEPRPRTAVPEVVMEQLRLARMMEEPLPQMEELPPPLQLETPAPILSDDSPLKMQPSFLEGDTVSYDSALTDLYRRKMVDLIGQRLRVLPLADTTSEAGRRRTRADEIIVRAIEAMGGVERLQAVRDKRVEREAWSDRTSRWEPVDIRYYLRGSRYRQDVGRGVARGYDGQVSWFLRYGLLLPPRDESYNAERWDFLSRFRGDGVIAEYVGRRTRQYRTLETLRIIDTRYGRQRLAYFDVRDSLLASETEAGTTTHYREYRETDGVLTPFEVIVAPPQPPVTRYRWHTELNRGLTADLFEVPETITWEPQMVQKVIFEHAPVPEGGAASLRLQVEALTQRTNPQTGRPYLGSVSMHLLDTYMQTKLERSGVLARSNEVDWRLSWRVEEFWLRGPPPVATIDISVSVQSLGAEDRLWQGRFQHRWKPTGAAIDDRMGDILTYRAISLASAGMAQLSGVEPIPAAQPDSMPSAPSSSGRP